jgi:hypothetical protein
MTPCAFLWPHHGPWQHCGNFKLQSRLHNAIIVNPAIEPASLDTEYMIADPCIIRDQMGQPIKREQQQAK